MSKQSNNIYRYTFFYEDLDDITYLCIGENLDTDVAFSYLADIKKCFLTSYDSPSIKTSFSYQFKDFSNNIKRISRNYEMNPNSKLNMLKNKLSETSSILKENIEKLMQKNEKLDIIAKKSRGLTDQSDTFLRNIKEIKRKQKLKC